jgi:TPR repeat protein
MNPLSRLAAATVFCAAGVSVAVAAPDTYLQALEIAAGQGDPKAQTELATRYEYAEDLPKDLQKAREIFC